MFADLLGSLGVAIAAIVILTTGWVEADPLVSILIGVLVLASAWSILRDSTEILLESTPRGIDARRARSATRRRAGRRRGARPPRVDDHVRLYRALGARARASRRGLPRPTPRARAAAPRRVRHRAHDASGRPCARRRPRRDGTVLGQEDRRSPQRAGAQPVERFVGLVEREPLDRGLHRDRSVRARGTPRRRRA